MAGRINLLLGIQFILCFNSAISQVIFQKIFSDSGDVFAKSNIQTSDMKFVITGGNYSVGASYPHVFLSKSDSLGDLIWLKNYNIETSNLWESICAPDSNGFALAGTTISNSSVDVHVIRTDSFGNVLWSKYYDSNSYEDNGTSITTTSDNGFMVTGFTTHAIPCCRDDIFLLKIDSTGEVKWSRTYHIFDQYEFGYCVKETHDSGYIIAGRLGGVGALLGRIYLIKTDSIGNIQWSYTYGLGQAYSIEPTNDEGYIVTGGDDLFLLKMNSLGVVEWKKNYQRNGTSSYGYSVKQMPDSGYLVCGKTGPDFDGHAEILRTNKVGDTLWTKYYGGNADEELNSASLKTNGEFCFSGYTFNFSNHQNVWLISTDSLGNSRCNELFFPININNTIVNDSIPITTWDTLIWQPSIASLTNYSSANEIVLCSSINIQTNINSQNQITISPNPAESFIHVESDFPFTNFEIMNLWGEVIHSDYLKDRSNQIDISYLGKGIYYLIFLSKDLRTAIKLVKM